MVFQYEYQAKNKLMFNVIILNFVHAPFYFLVKNSLSTYSLQRNLIKLVSLWLTYIQKFIQELNTYLLIFEVG